LNVAEYHRMAAVGLLSPDARVELIDGEIIDMAPVGSRHAAAVDLLGREFMRLVGNLAIVRIQGPIRLDEFGEPQPDVCLMRPRDDGYAGSHPRPLDVFLVVEVSDATLAFDLGSKARTYAAHAIAEYWVVDLVSDRLHRHRQPTTRGYREVIADAFGLATVKALRCGVDLAALKRLRVD
jgi:hypothetical protein